MQNIPDSLNHSNESPCKGFKNKVLEFQSIYFDSYGMNIEHEEAEIVIQEITKLLEEIIRINHMEKYER